jgi:hypothetical protein
MARMQPFQGWGDGSEPSGAARMVTRDGGVRYLVGLITQRQQFKSASRYEGWLRARAGTWTAKRGTLSFPCSSIGRAPGC